MAQKADGTRSIVPPLFWLVALAIVAAKILPEAMTDGWRQPTALAAATGMALPWLQYALRRRAGGRRRFNPLGRGLVLAGGLALLLSLANAIPRPGTEQSVILPVSEVRWPFMFRGRSRPIVATPTAQAPVPRRHEVRLRWRGRDLQAGDCMAFTWRTGLLWPVVVDRRAASCPPGVAPPPQALASVRPSPRSEPAAEFPIARPGPAWPQVRDALAVAINGLDLPAGGKLFRLLIAVDAGGAITAVAAQDGDGMPGALKAALIGKPGSVRGPGKFRIWLKLVPDDSRPPASVSAVPGRT